MYAKVGLSDFERISQVQQSASLILTKRHRLHDSNDLSPYICVRKRLSFATKIGEILASPAASCDFLWVRGNDNALRVFPAVTRLTVYRGLQVSGSFSAEFGKRLRASLNMYPQHNCSIGWGSLVDYMNLEALKPDK